MRPNIVFAFADDWGRYASAYRCQPGENSIHELIDTPNFDRVANEGVLFRNAHVPAPSCTPCRSSILSGRYFWQTGLGAILLGARWDEKIPTYPLMLAEAGYDIGYTYKVWSPGVAVNAPYGGARTAFESAGTHFNAFSHRASERMAEVGLEHAKSELLEEVRLNFLSFLDRCSDDKPFCYWWGPTNTHRTWEQGSGKTLWGLDPDNLQGRLPEFLPDVHEVRGDFNDYLGECLAFDAGLGVLIDELEATGQLDSTMLVVSGDHGVPGFPRAKCNLYNIGTEVALATRWPGIVKPGRLIDDFVNLMDLAPTFLEAAGVPVDPQMSGTSLVPLMRSSSSGQVDLDRTFVITGRERHVASTRVGHLLPYPQRAIRTRDYLYIYNFEPDRWPIGDPQGLEDLTAEPPPVEEILNEYDSVFPDIDKSPTKAWMIYNRARDDVAPLFWLGFGKRPQEELYDLSSDPDYMINVSAEPGYQSIRESLNVQLMNVLLTQNDPRVTESPVRFEHEPFSGPVSDSWMLEAFGTTRI